MISTDTQPSTVPPQPAPEPVVQPPVQQETVVVPTGYDPNITIPGAEPVSTPQPRRGGCGFRFILVFLIIALILGAAAFGIRYAMQTVGGGGDATLTYWGLWENDSIIAPVIADFQTANPTIKVEYVKQSHKQYRERLSAAIARGDGPDVFRFHNTWIAMLYKDLATVPPTIMTPEVFSSTFYPVAKNDLVSGTNIFGIPMEIDGLGLYINEDIFAAAGASAPVTWEDVLALVPKLTVKNGQTITTSAIALGTTSNVEHWSDILATMMLQNGVKLTSPTGAEAEQALVFFHKFADPGDLMYTWNGNLDNSVYAFAGGRVAMIMAPSWRAFDIKQINPNVNFKILPIPQLPGNTVNWASYWVEGVSGKSKNKEAAWTFVSYMTSRDAVTKLYSNAAKTRLFGEPYARKDLAPNVAGDRYVETYVKQADTSQSFPLASKTWDNGLNDQLIKYLEDAVNGLDKGGSPTLMLGTAAKGFSQVLTRYGLISAAAPPAK